MRTTITLGALALCLAAGSTASAKPGDVQTLRLAIQGMVTPNCPVLVKTGLGKQQGVKSVEASLEQKSASVQYVEGQIDEKKILHILKDQVGFDAKVVRTANLAVAGLTPDKSSQLEQTIKKVNGVVAVKSDVKAKTAAVDYLDGDTTPADIAKAIQSGTGLVAKAN